MKYCFATTFHNALDPNIYGEMIVVCELFVRI